MHVRMSLADMKESAVTVGSCFCLYLVSESHSTRRLFLAAVSLFTLLLISSYSNIQTNTRHTTTHTHTHTPHTQDTHTAHTQHTQDTHTTHTTHTGHTQDT